MNIKNIRILTIATLILLVIGIPFYGKIVETVDFGTYHIKQAIVSGDMSVQAQPGMYNQFFGSITVYKQAGELPFSKEQLDGGDGAESQPLGCTFMGNSTADVGGVLKYQLGTTDSSRLELHRLYGNNDAIKLQLVRNTVAAALKQTGPMFRAEEAFITRRGEFTNIVQGMIENGLYKTESYEDVVLRDNKKIKVLKTRLSLDSLNKPIVTKISPFKKFGIIVQQFDIKNFDFDKKTDELIQKKKDAEQTMVVSRAKAEKAKQDAITAVEEGKAKIAKAEAEELESKIREVTQAEKAKAVAILNAQQKFEVANLNEKASMKDAQKKINIGQAEAKIAKLKVIAGLSPREKAEFDMKTKIGVARELSKITLPQIVVGGGSKGSGPMDAINIKFLQEINKNISKTK